MDDSVIDANVGKRSALTAHVVAIDARLACGTSTGDSTYWTGLLYGLSQIDVAAKILLFSNAPRPQDIPWHPSFEWIQLQSSNSRWWSYVLFPLAARRAGARAIHTQYSLSPLIRKGGITTIHDVSFLIGPEWFSRKDHLLLSRLVPAAARRAAKVITVSETSRKEIIKYIPSAQGKVEVTYNACPPWIRSVPREEALLHLGNRPPFLLTVGTRWPRKNMSLAVEAASLLPAHLPHRLVITGKQGWGDQELGARGESVGYVDHHTLSCLYSAADLYLAPSFHEGFGIPMLEAFHCGCPVLSSSGGALPEVANSAAKIVDSYTPEVWASEIECLLGDRSTLGALREAGRAREKEFSWAKTARETLDIYEQVSDDRS